MKVLSCFLIESIFHNILLSDINETINKSVFYIWLWIYILKKESEIKKFHLEMLESNCKKSLRITKMISIYLYTNQGILS